MRAERITILGTSGSGKTTLARRLAQKLKLQTYDLDDIFWKRKYDLKRDEQERIQALRKITSKRKWIIEGVYSGWIDDAIKRSEIVLLIDIHPLLIVGRLLKRAFKRRRQGSKGNWKDTIALIKYALRYKLRGQNAGYYLHKRLIAKYNRPYKHIKTKKEVEQVISMMK